MRDNSFRYLVTDLASQLLKVEDNRVQKHTSVSRLPQPVDEHPQVFKDTSWCFSDELSAACLCLVLHHSWRLRAEDARLARSTMSHQGPLGPGEERIGPFQCHAFSNDGAAVQCTYRHLNFTGEKGTGRGPR